MEDRILDLVSPMPGGLERLRAKRQATELRSDIWPVSLAAGVLAVLAMHVLEPSVPVKRLEARSKSWMVRETALRSTDESVLLVERSPGFFVMTDRGSADKLASP